jgi:hypothetical protein
MGAVRAQLGQTAPLSPLLAVRSGYAESPGWFMVQAAEFDPEPLTVRSLRVRDTYASETIVRALLELMASELWFDRNAREEYALTEKGRAMLASIFARRRSWIERLDARGAPVDELAQSVRALIDASCATEHAWCIRHSRRRAHLQEISPLGVIFQALEDFNAFRDDAHMAAWQAAGVTGHVWETFAFVSGEQAANAGALLEQLHYRGYTRAEFADALTALAWRGWVEPADDENYRVTPQGRDVRAQVERATDEYFFAPWRALSTAEVTRLYGQLETLKLALERG